MSPKTANAVAAPKRIHRSGSRVPRIPADPDGDGVRRDHPDRGPEPRADGFLAGRERDGSEHRLVPELRQEERGPDGEDDRPGRALRLVGLGFVEEIAAQRPGGKDEERDAGDDGDQVGRQGLGDGRAEDDRAQVHQEGRRGDADEHVDRAIAGREGKRHELALVAELGDEDDGEAEQEGVHASSRSGRSGW